VHLLPWSTLTSGRDQEACLAYLSLIVFSDLTFSFPRGVREVPNKRKRQRANELEAGRGRRGAFVPLPSPLEHGPERGNEVVPQPA
jgi:hypothetical protein